MKCLAFLSQPTPDVREQLRQTLERQAISRSMASVSCQSGTEEEEEVRSDLNRSSRSFSIVHFPRRGDSAAAIGCRPVARVHDQHRPHFPPDRIRDDAAVIYHVIMIGSGHEYWRR